MVIKLSKNNFRQFSENLLNNITNYPYEDKSEIMFALLKVDISQLEIMRLLFVSLLK